MNIRIFYLLIIFALTALAWLVYDEYYSDRVIEFAVYDAETSQPIGSASIVTGNGQISTKADGHGSYVGPRLRGKMSVTSPGYLPTEVEPVENSLIEARLQPTLLAGRVVDALSNAPIVGADIVQDNRRVKTGPDGGFSAKYLFLDKPVTVGAPGFLVTSIPVDSRPVLVALQPRVITIEVLSDKLGPLKDVEVAVGEQRGRSDQNGKATLTHVESGQTLRIAAPDHDPASTVMPEGVSFRITLHYSVLTGRVLDKKTGRPVPNAVVLVGSNEGRTDKNGEFRILGVQPGRPVTARASGYSSSTMVVNDLSPITMQIEKESVKALYLTYYGVGNAELRDNALQLIAKTEANALVIDVKGDRGWLVYKSSIPAVKEYGAQKDIMISDPKAFLADLKRRGVYSIARIVVFKDDPLTRARPDLAVKDSRTGGRWIDGEGLGWADPNKREVWEYNVAIAKEAAEFGFDEIQFDYIRFPSDPSASTSVDRMVFSKPSTEQNRLAAIGGFLEYARSQVAPTGARLAIDVFGYTTWREDDMGIGQKLEVMAPHVDVISPMLYPNLFWDGILIDGDLKYSGEASKHPYEIVYQSLKRASERLKNTGVAIRPWLQYYDDYLLNYPYGPDQFLAQKAATYDAGISGWMFWDPTNLYKKGGFEPER